MNQFKNYVIREKQLYKLKRRKFLKKKEQANISNNKYCKNKTKFIKCKKSFGNITNYINRKKNWLNRKYNVIIFNNKSINSIIYNK